MLQLLAAAGLALAAGGAFVLAGTVSDDELTELSGLAASRARPGLLWALNDSGHAPRLFAVDPAGGVVQRVALRQARNIDWEDLGWFEEGGQPYLLVADIGDNLSWRAHLTLYVVPEPVPGAEQALPARRIEFTYEDGPRDAEALAVDARSGRILVLEKRPPPAGLYELPLHPPEGAPVVARRIAELQDWPRDAPAPVQTYGSRKYRNVATAMDISRDGRRMLVLSYTHVLTFERARGETWTDALARTPEVHRAPRSRGLEAACFDADDRAAWIGREGKKAFLYRAQLN